MAKHVWLVFTNATPGDDSEFNRWYDEIHIPDLLKVPGVISARRAEITEVQMDRQGDDLLITTAAGIGAKFKYLARYYLDMDSVDAFLREVQRRANTPDMVISETLGDVYTLMVRDNT